MLIFLVDFQSKTFFGVHVHVQVMIMIVVNSDVNSDEDSCHNFHVVISVFTTILQHPLRPISVSVSTVPVLHVQATVAALPGV